MKKRMLLGGLLLSLVAVSPARAASVSVVAQLDPGQTGPIYGWSLLISNFGGVGVGSLGLVLSGFDGFDFANPIIEPLDSTYIDDPIGDGRDLLLINPDTGQLLAPVGTFQLRLGTLFSHFNNVQQVRLLPADDLLGGTVFGPAPEYAVISDFTLTVVPEPRALSLALAVFAVAALRTARRRGA